MTFNKHLSQLFQLCALFLLLLFGSGCAGRRGEHFALFARAGDDYSRALGQLMDETALAAIDADSYLMAQDRDRFTEEERLEIYQQRTQALRQYLLTIRSLQRHAALLQRYFSTLAVMATTDEPETVAEEARALVASIKELHHELSDAFPDQRQWDEVLEYATPLTAAAFKRRALERELRNNAQFIDRELGLQEELLRILAADLKSDLEVIFEARGYTEVARPYIETGRLPANWPRRRREILSGYVTLGAVDNAADAAAQVRKMFRLLIKDQVRMEDWSRLFGDLHSMLDLVEAATRAMED